MDVFFRLSPPKPTVVFDTYWRFAVERQNIFFKRLEGQQNDLTSDPILQKYKFTNAYRASDRVSQYLIKHIIYNGSQIPRELFFRIILFKIFNRITTWELLTQELGELSYTNYSYERFDEVLSLALQRKQRLFSAAYIMPSGRTLFASSKKHRNYLKLLQMMLEQEVPTRLMRLSSMEEGYHLLHSYPLIGNFLAYQYITDINYSQLTNFSEMDFVMPGPGARSGIRKCFSSPGDLNDADIIRYMADQQEEEFICRNLCFRSLWGRPLQLIDCQNLFCEVDKYARLAHPEIKGIHERKRIKQIYQSNHEEIQYWYAPKWNINHLITHN